MKNFGPLFADRQFPSVPGLTEKIRAASFGLTICAERAAIFAAVARGTKQIDKVVVVSEGAQRLPLPCGACLQVMSEFGVRTVIVGSLGGPFKTYELKDLLPQPFRF